MNRCSPHSSIAWKAMYIVISAKKTLSLLTVSSHVIIMSWSQRTRCCVHAVAHLMQHSVVEPDTMREMC